MRRLIVVQIQSEGVYSGARGSVCFHVQLTKLLYAHWEGVDVKRSTVRGRDTQTSRHVFHVMTPCQA